MKKLTEAEEQEYLEEMQKAYPLAVRCLAVFAQEAIEVGLLSENPTLENDLQRAVDIIKQAKDIVATCQFVG
ncbi:hypothetical protein [Actinobacillus delphinicola]|uniref:Uncharacterized protein n=1 Tax=Actinobacillus delphinicola TaxID=51161 RepID=A0A448TUW1_9PAST|nr:hypothetical protein [Actinobacillus delphinicola]VEJ09727.1 Uncharacterised protein [Actinobacillus delphinicola]